MSTLISFLSLPFSSLDHRSLAEGVGFFGAAGNFGHSPLIAFAGHGDMRGE